MLSLSLNTPWLLAWLVLGHNPLYPGHHLGHPGVDPGVLLLGAPDAPGDDTDLFAGSVVRTVEQRTARVALNHHSVSVGWAGRTVKCSRLAVYTYTAGVLLVVAGTQHVRSDPSRG